MRLTYPSPCSLSVFMSGLQIPGMIQSWLLYHNALSQGVVTKNLLNFARKLKTKDETDVAKGEGPGAHPNPSCSRGPFPP